MTPHEETVILEAREILGRYLNQNPVLGNWQAVRDYCAVYAEAEIIPMLATKCLNSLEAFAS